MVLHQDLKVRKTFSQATFRFAPKRVPQFKKKEEQSPKFSVEQEHTRVRLKSFHLNDCTLGFQPQT